MPRGGNRLIFFLSALIVVVAPALAAGQTAPPPASLSALVEQTVAFYPKVEAEVIEAQSGTITLALGRAQGAQPGLALEVVRQGREIRHPRTGEVLGRAEQTLGRAVVTRVAERFATARYEGEPVQPGDRARSADRVRLTLVSLTTPGVKPNLVEAAVNEIYDGLNRTGRFQIVFGEQIAVWLAQQKIAPEEFVQGRGAREVGERFKTENMLVLHFKPVERKPFVEARLFILGRPDAALASAFFVPPSVQPVQPGRFSGGGGDPGPTPEKKPRSLLARLLGWGSETSVGYSAAEAGIPLKEIARLPFTVTGMDVAVAPADKIPRVALSDGQKIFVYRIVNQNLEPEWTWSPWALGRIFSVQLADLTGSGRLEVVANRYDARAGLNSVIVGLQNGKPTVLADNIEAILLAVDEQGTGVARTLWAQRFREETFFNKGQADEMALKDGALVKVRSVPVPDSFRATGATFTNVAGKDTRGLAYIDEQNRLRVTNGLDEIYRSGSQVGGGGEKIEVVRYLERGGRSFFFRLEPTPLAVDLDGDGIQELLVPQNHLEGGVLAVIFRGPAGLRLQQVNSGFDGVIRALGAFPGEAGGPPTLVAAVVRYRNFLRVAGETQLIMTLPPE
jgi:hypothetical protein